MGAGSCGLELSPAGELPAHASASSPTSARRIIDEAAESMGETDNLERIGFLYRSANSEYLSQVRSGKQMGWSDHCYQQKPRRGGCAG